MHFKVYLITKEESISALLVCMSQDQYVAERSEIKDGGPLLMNAFEMITLSQGLNLSALFDRRQV